MAVLSEYVLCGLYSVSSISPLGYLFILVLFRSESSTAVASFNIETAAAPPP